MAESPPTTESPASAGSPALEALRESLGELLRTLSRNKLRSILTASGVFWGMAMMLLMAGFGNGLEVGVQRKLGRRASNAVWFWGRTTSMPFEGRQPGREVNYRSSDVDAIRENVPGLEVVVGRSQLGGWRYRSLVRHGQEEGEYQVAGDEPDYRKVQPMQITAGRWLNPLDLQQRRKVAVIGQEVVEQLFPKLDPDAAIGQPIEVDGVWFTIAGTFRSPLPGDEGERAESTVHVPLPTLQQVFHMGDRVNWLAASAVAEVSVVDVEDDIRGVLQLRHGVHPDDAPAIGSRNGGQEFRRIQATFRGIRYFVLLVGSLTILAGAFGVSNVMLVSVRERMVELGLRRALGATPADIRRMVLMEALLLCALAGVAGLVVGLGGLELARAVVGTDHEVLGDPRVSMDVIGASIAILALAGLVAGQLPARRAVEVAPVDALRSE